MIFVEAILFDLDGTLIDSKDDLARSVQFLQRRYKAKLSSHEEVARFIGDGVVKLVRRALPELAPGRLGAAVDLFKKYYRAHCLDRTRLYPGVRRTLEHFKEKKMAVVTNKPVRVSGLILEKLRISHYFQVLVGGDSLPRKKPHPEPVTNALRTLGLRPSKKILVVGDGPNDVRSGKAAKVRTCGILSNITDHQNLLMSRPDRIIHHMTDLIRFFK